MSSQSLIFRQGTPFIRPAVLAKGFRPFFLAAAAFAVLSVPLWTVELFIGLELGAYFGVPMLWHAHEMVFGYTMAVVAGFLLTAVSNWTSQNTATGSSLMALLLLWFGGRITILAAPVLPPWLPALVDVAFVPALALTLGRPIVASKNWRNFGFIVLLALLAVTNAGTHLGAHGVLPGWLRLGNLVAIDVIALLMIMITGRVVPMFTRNATRIESIRSSPTLDRAALIGMVLLIVMDIALLPNWLRAFVAAFTGAATLARMYRWGTRHTVRQPLLWVLHVGHIWIGIAMLLRAGSILFDQLNSTAALHALTAGAIGTLTLGMMTRVALGHTGRMLVVPPRMAVAFGAVTCAALIRVFVPMFGSFAHSAAVIVSAVLWTVGFGIYLLSYAPILCRPRVDQRPG